MSATALDTIVTTLTSIGTTAPAKVNLSLDVLGRRDDGYHELRSLVLGVDLHDLIRCRMEPEPGLKLSCSLPALQNTDNLAYRAALMLARRVGLDPALTIEIEKAIPVASGLGGGSSDAAATLRLCNELWGCGLVPEELADIGAELGSDVPLFFSLPTALITGRGEHVQPVRLRWSGWILLASVPTFVSTPEVYGAWRTTDTTRGGADRERGILDATTADEISAMLSNDLQEAVFRVSPMVAGVYESLNQEGLGPLHLTGAGATLYKLFDERETACRAARDIETLNASITTAVVAAPAGPGSMVNQEQ